MTTQKINLTVDQLYGALHASNAEATYIEAWDEELCDQLIAELEAVDNYATIWTAEDGGRYDDFCRELDLNPGEAAKIYTFAGNTICLAEDWQ